MARRRSRVALSLVIACVTRPLVAQTPARVWSVQVSPASMTAVAGGLTRLLARVDADAGVANRTVRWSTSDSTIMTVDATGTVFAIRTGSARIVATSNADPAVKGSAVVTVVERTTTSSSTGVFPVPAAPPGTDQVYFEFQVQKQVSVIPGSAVPRYPDVLRAANVQGSVLIQFVVDTAGDAETNTVRVMRSTHALFTDAVRAVLPAIRFTPAEIGGRKVRQLVQMPFEFGLTKPPAR